MSGISLDKFHNLETDHQVLKEGHGDVVQRPPDGNLFGRMFRILTRGDAEKTANNEITREFFKSLEKTYGKAVAEWAVQGFESRVDDGKPLTGRRVQQILERARIGQDELSPEVALQEKAKLFRQKAPEFVRQALEHFDIPEDKRQGWKATLVAMLSKDPPFAPHFDPLGYDQEFRLLVANLVDTHRMALETIGRLEAKRQDLYNHGFDWEGARPQDVEQFAFPQSSRDDYRQNFLRQFGDGDDKTSDLDAYFHETVLTGAQKNFTRTFGAKEPEKMYDYDVAREGGKAHNGTYLKFERGFSEFLFFQRMDKGTRVLVDEEVRGEKFHVSVRPQDVGKVFETLAPILTREDSPIPMWKIVDVDEARKSVETMSLELEQLREAKEDDPSAFTSQQQERLDKLPGKISDAQRLRDSCQFTLYLDPEREIDDKNVPRILREIENTLTEIGIEPTDLPGSDEIVGQFVTFRTGAVTLVPGDDGYEQARLAQRRDEGERVTVRIDPQGEDYETHKVKFRDNPHYVEQVGVIVDVRLGEVSRLSQQLRELGDDRGGFAKLAGELTRLGETLAKLNLPEESKAQLDGAYRLLRAQFDEHVRARAGVSERTNELIGNTPVDRNAQAFIDKVRVSTFDDGAKIEVEQILTLSSKLMATASNPDTPLEDRLRLAGELESLRDALLKVLYSQRNNVDGDGQALSRAVQTQPYRPDFGDIGDNFRQPNRMPIPEPREHVSDMFCRLGVTLESLDRGLPLIGEEKAELKELLEGLDAFYMNGPVGSFRQSSDHLQDQIARVRDEVIRQLGPL